MYCVLSSLTLRLPGQPPLGRGPRFPYLSDQQTQFVILLNCRCIGSILELLNQNHRMLGSHCSWGVIAIFLELSFLFLWFWSLDESEGMHHLMWPLFMGMSVWMTPGQLWNIVSQFHAQNFFSSEGPSEAEGDAMSKVRMLEGKASLWKGK